jgi:hypothetical protein
MGVTVTPHYKVLKKIPVDAGQPAAAVLADREGTPESFHEVGVKRVLEEFKETVCAVSEIGYNEG